MEDDGSSGFSSSNLSYIAGLTFVALLLLGPVEPYGMMTRILYLIAVPFAVWFALRFMGNHLDIDAQANDYVSRAITASLAGMLFLAAYQESTARQHMECSESVRDGDSTECIGELVMKPGPDKGNAFILILFAGLAFGVAISRRPSE